MQVQLHRVFARLHDHEKLYLDVLTFLRRHGFGPADPLIVDMERSLRQVQGCMETVRAAIGYYAPYRPSIDPWKNSGLAAHLRPDFKARGITERPKEP